MIGISINKFKIQLSTASGDYGFECEFNSGLNTDIKSDSSASDFVRLIWAYLLSIYIVSSKNSGNHLGLIVFDEPAQHSMGVSSINALLKILSSQQSALQSIVSASFDEDDQVFFWLSKECGI